MSLGRRYCFGFLMVNLIDKIGVELGCNVLFFFELCQVVFRL